MGFGELLLGLCCCCFGDTGEQNCEKEPLRSGHQKSVSMTQPSIWRDEDWNLWSSPHDLSHMETDDDRQLCTLIVARNQLDEDTEVRGHPAMGGVVVLSWAAWASPDSLCPLQEWEKLNFDIHSLRQVRREVKGRWRKILHQLGFQKEVESLLSVTKSSTLSDATKLGEAKDILLKLAEETGIFPSCCGMQERYVFVVPLAPVVTLTFTLLLSMTFVPRPDLDVLKSDQSSCAMLEVFSHLGHLRAQRAVTEEVAHILFASNILMLPLGAAKRTGAAGSHSTEPREMQKTTVQCTCPTSRRRPDRPPLLIRVQHGAVTPTDGLLFEAPDSPPFPEALGYFCCADRRLGRRGNFRSSYHSRRNSGPPVHPPGQPAVPLPLGPLWGVWVRPHRSSCCRPLFFKDTDQEEVTSFDVLWSSCTAQVGDTHKTCSPPLWSDMALDRWTWQEDGCISWTLRARDPRPRHGVQQHVL
ncbi:MREG protein, partial [Polypterus senegalus]